MVLRADANNTKPAAKAELLSKISASDQSEEQKSEEQTETEQRSKEAVKHTSSSRSNTSFVVLPRAVSSLVMRGRYLSPGFLPLPETKSSKSVSGVRLLGSSFPGHCSKARPCSCVFHKLQVRTQNKGMPPQRSYAWALGMCHA